MKNKMIKGFKRYLSDEIAIEYKACLYFFAILFFYCVYLIYNGIYSAKILHMSEMILTTYIMGYLQVYGLYNFDEAEKLSGREAAALFLCSGLYTAVSFFFGWFGQSMAVTGLFFLYMLFMYWCAYLVNKIKRTIDTENLNKMLKEFKEAERSE